MDKIIVGMTILSITFVVFLVFRAAFWVMDHVTIVRKETK